MVRTKRINPLARAIAVMSAVVMVSGGATFAVLNGQAELAGNTISAISSETEGLLVNNKQDNNFSETEQGFDFNGLEPGEWSEKKHFQLRNDTGEPIDIYLQITGESALPPGVDGEDIIFQFKTEDGTIRNFNWTELIFIPRDLLVEDLGVGDTENVKVRVMIDESVEEEPFDIASFDFTFSTEEED